MSWGVGRMAIQLTAESEKRLIAYFNYLKDYVLAAPKLTLRGKLYHFC